MTTSSRPRVNHLGRDVSSRIPAWDAVPGLVALGERDEAIWALAAPYLTVRDNDAHSLFSYGLAAALLSQLPEANEAIVLPAILLKSVLLAVGAGLVAARFRKVTLPLLLGVVLFYQVAGTLGEWMLSGSLFTALQDFRIGIPGMLLQVLGGYWLICRVLKK